MCTVSGCGLVRSTAWTGSPAWAVPLILALAVGGGWLLLLPSRPVPTGIAALAAAVGGLGAMVVVATGDALVFGRAGIFPFSLPVAEEFPVLSVRPGIGLLLGLFGLLALATAGWMTVRARDALVTPWRPPRRAAAATGPVGPGRHPDRPDGADRPDRPDGGYGPRSTVGLGQGPPPPRAGRPTRAETRTGHRRARHR